MREHNGSPHQLRQRDSLTPGFATLLDRLGTPLESNPQPDKMKAERGRVMPNRADHKQGPARNLRTAAVRILPVVERRLRREYGGVPVGSAPLGNKRNPLDELVYIQLSVRTRETAYQSTYPSLRRLVGGAWEQFLRLPAHRILPVLHPGGMSRVKLARLRAQFSQLRAILGRVTLAPLRAMTTEDAEALLRSLPGVGPKVARCVLLYSLDREVFPVDSNCRRVLARLGFVPAGLNIKATHDFLQALVPERIRRSLHVNLIHHGRARCLPAVPQCPDCPLLSLCPTGRRLTSGRAIQKDA
jgi:endonuclease III